MVTRNNNEGIEKEIENLTKEEAIKDINCLREELSILFEQEDKTMKNPRKLPYREHWMNHWKKRIVEQYLFFYNLGLNSIVPPSNFPSEFSENGKRHKQKLKGASNETKQ